MVQVIAPKKAYMDWGGGGGGRSISLMCFQWEFIVNEISFYCNSGNDISICMAHTHCGKIYNEHHIRLGDNERSFPSNYDVKIGSIKTR